MVFYLQEHKYILKLKYNKPDTKYVYSETSIYIIFKQSYWNYILKYRFMDFKTVKENTEAIIVTFRVIFASKREQWHFD